MNRDELKVVEVWKIHKSPVALFVEKMENSFGLVIHYRMGNIVRFNPENSPHLTEVVLTFELNNETLAVEGIYYDDKQLLLRLVNDQSKRRVNLKSIRQV
ncbi:hypothetical protein, partial [Terribacillus saccharophilus]|uniref:hypothetical protein n=1 Tax=Terribacillus saccharophilus TaxID=361277 RepID=UPI00113FE430